MLMSFPTAFLYPELNTSQMLRSSWLRTGTGASGPASSAADPEVLLRASSCPVNVVLLGVQDQKVGERTFQASMERRVAMLLGEAMGGARRVKRATAVGNSSVQVSQQRHAGSQRVGGYSVGRDLPQSHCPGVSSCCRCFLVVHLLLVQLPTHQTNGDVKPFSII